MKKTVLYLCAGVMIFSLAACGGKEQGDGAVQGTESSGAGEVNGTVSAEDSGEDIQESSSGEGENDTESGAVGSDITEGWSPEMESMKNAVIEALGEEEYWPDMPMDTEMLELFCGITPDLYEDYMAESPMISGNVDTLIIVRAKTDMAEAVEAVLNAYREANVNDTMQYPQNLGKIQASRVERVGSYVIFAQLGGYAIDAEEEEEVIAKCKEANQLAIDAICKVLDEQVTGE